MGMVPPPIIQTISPIYKDKPKEDDIYAIVEPVEKEVFKWCETCKDFVEIEDHICVNKAWGVFIRR